MDHHELAEGGLEPRPEPLLYVPQLHRLHAHHVVDRHATARDPGEVGQAATRKPEAAQKRPSFLQAHRGAPDASLYELVFPAHSRYRGDGEPSAKYRPATTHGAALQE